MKKTECSFTATESVALCMLPPYAVADALLWSSVAVAFSRAALRRFCMSHAYRASTIRTQDGGGRLHLPLMGSPDPARRVDLTLSHNSPAREPVVCACLCARARRNP
jgi:hypothetical protein